MAILEPSPYRMTLHALAVLAEARELAKDAPIAASPAVRLAFSWLVHTRVADNWQVHAFWTALTKPSRVPDSPQAGYMRIRDMDIHLDAWREKVTRPPKRGRAP